MSYSYSYKYTTSTTNSNLPSSSYNQKDYGNNSGTSKYTDNISGGYSQKNNDSNKYTSPNTYAGYTTSFDSKFNIPTSTVFQETKNDKFNFNNPTNTVFKSYQDIQANNNDKNLSNNQKQTNISDSKPVYKYDSTKYENQDPKSIKIDKFNKSCDDVQAKFKDLSDDKVFELGAQGQLLYKDMIQKTSKQITYDEILDSSRKGIKFEDNSFPPNDKSLHNNDSDFTGKAYGIKFQNIKNIYGSGYKVFLDQIEPNDIRQGELGDCYFLATLASIAEWPERVKKIFHPRSLTQEAIDAGCFAVNIVWRGLKTEVIVDDFFPCRGNNPAYTKGNGKELWVLILEKVWAKLHNCYYYIEAGLTREPLHDLTGAPSITIFTAKTDQNYIWSQIINGEKENYIMTAGTAGDDDSNTNHGLVEGHAYSLLAGYEVNYRGSIYKLVKMRNPWGDTEWTDNWSDNDSRWNEVSKSEQQRIGYSKNDDGIFFMEFSDFLHYYDAIQICYYNDDFKFSSFMAPIQHQTSTFIEITINKAGVYFFGGHHLSQRTYAEDEQRDYPKCEITIYQSDKKTVVTKIKKQDRDIFCGHVYQKGLDKQEYRSGTYYAEVKVEWQDRGKHRLAISAYGKDEVTFKA